MYQPNRITLILSAARKRIENATEIEVLVP